MNSRVHFAIALHFHQPVGNFEHIFEQVYKSCYRPFFKLLVNYPELKMMFHVSGCLLDYFDKKHPEAIELIKYMASRGQIEIMSGAYYEPILTAISPKDVIGQIKMMSEYIKHKFNVTPGGMWAAERVWHPDLIEPIYKAGIRYLILDDEHLLRSGLKQKDIYGYFLTGDRKEKLAVFPSSKKLRYLIPFRPPQETIDYFRDAGEKHNTLFTYGDDGEKFGEWPGTHKLVFEDKWLNNFFDVLGENKSWIEPVHFSDYLKNQKPTGILKIQQGSYQEMMKWSDGCWLNFLSKYPESNQMHKKAAYVGSKIEKIKKKAGPKEARRIKDAVKELYMAQCNCGWWHGVFGGLYLYHLRRAVYNHLIEADKRADSLLHGGQKKWLELRRLDFNLDGREEIIMENKNFSVYIDPHDGGVIKELDYRPLSFNLLNTFSRKREPYHQRALSSAQKMSSSKAAVVGDDSRSPGFAGKLSYDKFGRYFLRSYLVREDLGPSDFINSRPGELGDFSTGIYAAGIEDKKVTLERESGVSEAAIGLRKEIGIKSENEIELFCSIKKERPGKLNALFGLEFNLTMPDLDASRYSYYFDEESEGGLNRQGCSFPAATFGIRDALDELSVCFFVSPRPLYVWYFPVETISQSEKAYELNYQCSCMFVLWKLGFEKEDENSFKLDFVFNPR